MPKTAAQKRAATLAKKRGTDWTVTIDAWDFYYSFGPQWQKASREPWSEFADLKLRGTIKGEKPLRSSLVVSVFGDRRVLEDKYLEPPKTIGHYQVGKEEITAAVWIPMDALAPLVAASNAGAIKRVRLEVDLPEHLQGGVRSIAIGTEEDEGD